MLVPIVAITLAAIASLSGGADGADLANLDFEDGTQGWAAWHSDDPNYKGPRLDWSIDKETFQTGKASLRVVADDRKGRIFVHQSTEKVRKGTRYELSYWIKFGAPDMYERCGVTINLRKPKKEGKGHDITQIEPFAFYKRGDRGWLHRRTFFVTDKDTDLIQLGASVKHTLGTVWFDDIRLTALPPGEIRVESMHEYTPAQVDFGDAMVARFQKARDKRPGLFKAARVYNQVLVESAQVAEEVRKLTRAAFYLDKGQTVKPEQEASAALEKRLDGLYLAYGRTFKEGKADEPEGFEREAKELSQKLGALKAQVAERLKGLQTAAQENGTRWTVPAEPKSQEQEIAASGKPNQLIFGTVSLQTHYELEEPLKVNRLFASAIFEARSDGPGNYDFSGILKSWDFHKRLGITRSSLGTALAVHHNQMAPAWFMKKHGKDDDIYYISADGKKPYRVDYSMGAPLNTWRPEVRAMTADLIAQIGKTFKDQSQYLFYVVGPENSGPYFPSENNNKSIGYNKSALPDFHVWLKKRYGTIDDLNRQWQTKHASFEAIKPPDDLLIADEWPRPHPAAYEFQTWRNDHHHHWLKFLYDEFKKADPNKPVMVDHSSLLSQIDGDRLFDTADLVSVHQDTMLAPTYIHSMNRFAKKHLALYENGWGFSDPMPHHASEVETRAMLMRYLYRQIAWGMHVQMWWYAYTQNDYIIRFNGNWFNPVYDLTTLRYSAAGLPVAKERVKRLESVLLNAKVQPARVVMLQPITSRLFQNYWGESFGEMQTMHDLLYARNNLHEVLPETYFTDGRARLDDFDVVILPYTPFFPDKLADQLRAWVKKGGTLVALGPCGLYDKFGNDKPDLWTDVFGKNLPTRLTKPHRYWERHREWRWGWDEKKDEAPILDQKYGAGRVVVSMRSLKTLSMRERHGPKLVEAVETRAPRAARCPSNLLEMNIHETADGKRYLFAINASTEKAATDRVTLAGEYQSGVDLDVPGGFPVPFRTERGETSFALRLEPGEFTLIELRK